MISLANLKIGNPVNWGKDEFYTNLQAAVDLEFWTIPLYLTALYSMKDVNDPAKKPADYPLAALLIESVVIEEMLHLELACNICNALGYSPQINIPVYSETKGIPFVKPSIPEKYQGFVVRLGGLDINQLKMFCAIELPEPKTKPDWSRQTTYNSIGELYQALEIAVTNLWEELYVGEAKSKQIRYFDDYKKHHKHSKRRFSQNVCDVDSAIAAMHTIVEQGEGNTSGVVPRHSQPHPKDPSQFDPGEYDPADSHFVKFNDVLDQLLNNKDFPAVYPIINDPNPEQLAQQTAAIGALQEYFADLISKIQTIFEEGTVADSFFNDMTGIKECIAAVWQSGAVPSFTPPSTEPDLKRTDKGAR